MFFGVLRPILSPFENNFSFSHRVRKCPLCYLLLHRWYSNPHKFCQVQAQGKRTWALPRRPALRQVQSVAWLYCQKKQANAKARAEKCHSRNHSYHRTEKHEVTGFDDTYSSEKDSCSSSSIDDFAPPVKGPKSQSTQPSDKHQLAKFMKALQRAFATCTREEFVSPSVHWLPRIYNQESWCKSSKTSPRTSGDDHWWLYKMWIRPPWIPIQHLHRWLSPFRQPQPTHHRYTILKISWLQPRLSVYSGDGSYANGEECGLLHRSGLATTIGYFGTMHV